MDDQTRFVINNQQDESCPACGSYDCNGDCADAGVQDELEAEQDFEIYGY